MYEAQLQITKVLKKVKQRDKLKDKFDGCINLESALSTYEEIIRISSNIFTEIDWV